MVVKWGYWASPPKLGKLINVLKLFLSIGDFWFVSSLNENLLEHSTHKTDKVDPGWREGQGT